jgi:hypothetical protein
VKKGRLRLSRPLPLPDGPVLLTVSVREARSSRRNHLRETLPLFGIWKERAEMADVVDYVTSLRKRHEKRGTNG